MDMYASTANHVSLRGLNLNPKQLKFGSLISVIVSTTD